MQALFVLRSSFGQSAVFLIGGKTLDEGGLPILVESGDVIVMSGESRLFYHGVPRILQAKVQLWNQVEQLSSEICENECFLKEVQEKVFDARLWEPFDCYVKKSRINMNVRQVLLPGQKSLDH